MQACQRRSLTPSLYSGKWQVFEEWCGLKHIIHFQCSVVVLLCFLQDLVDKGKAFSTVKVYLAAISVCHVGFGDEPASLQNPGSPVGAVHGAGRPLSPSI